jgi:Secretion system C-terminal sorting domain
LRIAYSIRLRILFLYVTVCDSLQSITELRDEDKISYYPNPNIGKFKLQYKGTINKSLILRIIDVYGNLIDVIETTNTTINYENTSLPSGLHFYSLSQGNEEVGRGKILIVK